MMIHGEVKVGDGGELLHDLHPRRRRRTMEEEQDRISSLPDHLRSKILSMMPIKDAAKASCLSSGMKCAFDLSMEMTIVEREKQFSKAFGEDAHSTTIILNHLSLRYLGFIFLQGKVAVPGSFDDMKDVTMDIYRRCILEMAAVCCVFQNARNIEALNTRFSDGTLEQYPVGQYAPPFEEHTIGPLMRLKDSLVPSFPGLEAYSFAACTFPHLMVIEMEEFHGFKEEFAVLKHMFLNSPCLEDVHMSRSGGSSKQKFIQQMFDNFLVSGNIKTGQVLV